MAYSRKNSRLLEALAFVLFGLLVIGGALVFYTATGHGEYQTTEATIETIDRHYVGGEYVYDVTVGFTVDGVEYHSVRIDTYSASMKVGKKIKVEYDVTNPNRARVPFTKIIPYILFGVGGLLLVIGIVKLIPKKEKPLGGKSSGAALNGERRYDDF